MSTRKHVRIEYRLRPEVDLEAYLAEVGKFVAGIGAHDPANEYATYRDEKDPRHFVHVGHFDDGIGERLQGESWFTTYTAHLRTLTVAPPDVIMLSLVASTR